MGIAENRLSRLRAVFRGVIVAFPLPTLAATVVFRKRGETETAEHNQIFPDKTVGGGSLKQGVWSADLGFSPHFRIGCAFSTLDAPTSSEKVLKTALKALQLALTAYNTHV